MGSVVGDLVEEQAGSGTADGPLRALTSLQAYIYIVFEKVIKATLGTLLGSYSGPNLPSKLAEPQREAAFLRQGQGKSGYRGASGCTIS